MADIRSLLPYAGPMVLLDRLVAANEESVTAEVMTRSGGNGLSSFDCEIVDVRRGPVATAMLTVFQPADAEELVRQGTSLS